MAAWPLNVPLVAGYGINPDNPVARTSMEGGPAKQRRRYTQAPSQFPVSWIFTEAEFATFEAFHKNDIYDGASWFTITLYNGQGASTYTARFIEMWRAIPVGTTHWQVTCTLETKTRPLS